MHGDPRLRSLTRGLPRESRENVLLACRFGREHLSAIRRRSGESYAEQGENVALTLRELSQDPVLLSVAVLHDILVHPEGEALLAAAPLNDDQRSLVRSLHSLRRLQIDAKTQDLDTVINAFTADTRLLSLRMAHRLTDVRHLEKFPVSVRRQIAKETLHMYAAIAGRLGMHAWRHEMEDRCFRLLQPKIVADMERLRASTHAVDTMCMEHGARFLQKRLRAQGIACTVDGRMKSLYSIYRKMIIKKRKFHELTDRLALRIIVGEVEECYRALGVVHASLHPIPGKLKDYIGAPKENGYRSIHTVVYPLPGVTEQPMEIQIRSHAMHRECEYGEASHGEYKNSLYALQTGVARVQLFRNLQSLRDETHSPKQFEEALRTYFSDEQIGLFDPKNTLYHLRQPVHALDFVCAVHGKRVKFLKSIRVNGRERPLDSPLADGDTVEARFGKTPLLRESWVQACKHRGSKGMLREMMLRENTLLITAKATH